MRHRKIKIALAGNPNSGKTTIFNHLVGAKEKVGNWSGTTVERKEGDFTFQGQKIHIVDLPGTYSLTAYSLDERIASNFLMKEHPDVVVAVIDASNLERNLFLVMQLLEMGENVLLVLNMMDVVKQHGIKINAQQLSQILHVPVIETVANRKVGLSILKDAITKAAGRQIDPLSIGYGELEEDIARLGSFFTDKDLKVPLNQRGIAVKIFDGDEDILEKIEDKKYFPEVMDIRQGAQGRLKIELDGYIDEKRHAYVNGVIKECQEHQLTIQQRLTLSDKIDEIITNRYLGIPIFLAFMYCLFTVVFKIGAPLVGWIDYAFAFWGQKIGLAILSAGLPAWVASLFSDGIIAGVGSVIAFVPYIALLFMGISILEDTGYLSRAAFIMDRMMHALGLHGKSFVPMLLGFGCSIPGILATRTLNSEKDRIITILILPLMSCAARLPVYTLFAAALFKKNQGLVVFSMYILGIALAVVMARIFRGFLFKGETTPLVMELPPYRMPTLKNVCLYMWNRSWYFVKKAGTLICLAVILIWALASLPFGVEYASENSFIGLLGQMIAPVFKPAGFGFWQAGVALISGVFAKEAVVGTLGTLYGVGEGGLTAVLQKIFTPLSGYAFLVMTLIYIPCVPTIVTIKAETNGKWALFACLYTFLLGWGLSVLVYQVGSLIIK